MKLLTLLSGLISVFLNGCDLSGSLSIKSEVMLEIVNESSSDLIKAEVHFQKFTCKWGWVITETSKSYGHYPHPITPEAELHWDETSGHRMEKIDLREIYPPGKSGRLTFTVYDDRVEATFREKP